MMIREDDYVVKIAVRTKLTGKRQNGRPRLRWFNDISSQLDEKNTSLKDRVSSERYKNRAEWRK